MTGPSITRPLPLGDLIGQHLGAVRARLGDATVDKRLADDRWLVYELPDARLRIRLTPDPRPRTDSERVASWTINFRGAGPRPTEVAECLGLRLADDLEPTPGDPRFLRSTLTDTNSGNLHSLTARVQDDRLVELTAFDEPPEWLGGPAAEGP